MSCWSEAEPRWNLTGAMACFMTIILHAAAVAQTNALRYDGADKTQQWGAR